MMADLVAIDRDDRPILVAEVKAEVLKSENGIEHVLKLMSVLDVPYGMLMDLEKILLLRGDIENPGVVARLNTIEVLRHYSAEFAGKDTPHGSRRVFHDYVVTLAGSWLRDFAYHWNLKTPPGTDEFARIGLLERLEGGFTHSEVKIGGFSLR